MEVTIQIFCGNFRKKGVSFAFIEKKLLSILSKMTVSKVLMGWSLDKSLYEQTANFLAERKIDFYLWFPVFSETGDLKDLSHLMDFHGQRLKSKKGTEFSFFCPNSQNIKKILNIFEREFAAIKFNGVFLDRIRYPSFGNNYGFDGVFSCFCPNCCTVYERENFNIEKLKIALAAPNCASLAITGYKGCGAYTYKEPALDDFFRLKANIIFKKMQQMCMFFRQRNYSVGFDVFAPFLSPFVGQNLEKLSCLCDFMKPMMYRVTNAPAGLPYETESLFRQTGYSDADKQNFYKILGIKKSESSRSVASSNPFDIGFAAGELETLSKKSACPVFAGVEINRVKGIAETDPGYIEETLKAYAHTGIGGFALSWNLLDMPEENLNKAAEVIRPYT